MAGVHTVRIVLAQTGNRTRLDYISYDTLPNSGIEGGTTWGSIKAMYR